MRMAFVGGAGVSGFGGVPVGIRANAACVGFAPSLAVGARKRAVRLSMVGGDHVEKQEAAELAVRAPGSNAVRRNEPQWKVWLRASAAAMAVAAALVFSSVDPAFAAQSSGGRVGGSSFRSAPAPSRSYSPPSGGGYGGGYGIAPVVPVSPFGFSPFGGSMFFPVYTPLGLGGGFGGLLFFGFAASLLVRSIASSREEAELEEAYDPETNLTMLKVGLLASASTLKQDLEKLAQYAETSSVRGLHSVLQDTVLTLVRHPDFWVYGCAENAGSRTRLSQVRSEFERISMSERSKLREEAMTNVKGIQRRQESSVKPGLMDGPAEYIVLTLIVAATGPALKTAPSQCNSAEDVQKTLMALGSVSVEDLQAVELIWAPAGQNETLSREQMLRDHPELKRL
ncbi:hypothetical protein FVE85_7633 [Porphyridium purpureum]|uniref:DUF1517 domain-containing protein n=1 Tax=Porphyridium purpureum TaxID=35688 RepID=A0A5J4ZAE0_PORPP|nr:hypothetical protein FVE85_7633 [Porphyridium purpureum]|eukprot:POR0063..scf295_1